MILLDPRARPVIGHRGNRAHAPENTLESLRQAVALGVDAVEFDLRVTRDGALVVIHDETLDRTTNGSGPVALRTVTELKGLDAGARFTLDGGRTFPWRGRGVRVPTFDEIIESLPRELPCIVELKTPAATELLRVAVRRHGIADRIIVAGFDPAATRPLRGAGFALGACTPDVVEPGASCAAAATHRSPALPGALHPAALERHSGADRRPGARAARQRHRDPCLDDQRPRVRAPAVARGRAGNPQR